MEINFTNSAFVIYPVHCLLVFITNYIAISDVSSKWLTGLYLLLSVTFKNSETKKANYQIF